MKKKIFRNFFLVGILFIFIFTSFNSPWAAEKKYPSGPIELFCGFAAGGQTDLFTRALAKGLEKYLGVTVVPGNKPGGGGIIPAATVATSRPDGYTIGLLSDSMIISSLLGRATYSMEDLLIIGVGIYDSAMVVSVDSPWKTIQEFVDYARKNPGIKYGHPGVGSTNFLITENLNKHANLMMIGVPFKGDPEIIGAVLGKHVPIGVFGYMNCKIQADAGKMRILLCFGGLDPTIPSQSTAFGKNVPHTELGYYLLLPRKTPDEIVQVLEQALEKVVKDTEFINNIKKVYVEARFIDSKTFMQKKLPEKISYFKSVIQDVGLMK